PRAPKPEATSPVSAGGEGWPRAPKPEATSPVSAGGEGGRIPDSDAVFLALASTIRVHRLPVALFEDLISAFRQDVTTTRYDTWEGLLDYCRRSANPVGRLVLRVAGATDDRLDCASDAVCTALQLTNFWQDVDRDWQKGRLYVPLADCRRFGAREEDLAARRWTAAWRLVLGDMASRTRRLFDDGRSVCDGVSGRLRYELRFTWLGGRRILDRLERAGFDVFTSRPALGLADVPALAWQATAWRKNPAAT
ncbi:MAG: squalene/phytoene synthase family protein, partial [Acidobacteriota bacterium]